MAESLKSVLEIMKETRTEFHGNEIVFNLTSDYADLNTSGEPLKIIKSLWKDTAVQECFASNSDKLKMAEAAEYFFTHIDRITKQDYLILHAKLRTKGIAEMCLDYEKTKLKILDVGGERSERRKWMHFFEDVSVIMYLVSLTDCDQFVEEDPDRSLMEESLQIFSSLINSRWFRKTPVLLFLNKMDRFELKIKSHPLNIYFSDFKGDPASYEGSVSYIKDKFLSVDKQLNRRCYCYSTCATNTENISTVLNVSLHTVLMKNIHELFG